MAAFFGGHNGNIRHLTDHVFIQVQILSMRYLTEKTAANLIFALRRFDFYFQTKSL